MNNKYDEEYREYLSVLDKKYKENPRNTISMLRKFIARLQDKKKNKIIDDSNRDIFIMAFLIIFIALIGLINIYSYPMYLFGLAFFLAGFFVGFSEKYFGLIFLISHGCTGMALMIGCQIYSVMENPLMQDNPYNIWIYMGIGIFLIVVALLIVLFYNLSDYVRSFFWVKNVVFGIMAIVFLMATLLPHIVNNLYSFQLFG